MNGEIFTKATSDDMSEDRTRRQWAAIMWLIAGVCWLFIAITHQQMIGMLLYTLTGISFLVEAALQYRMQKREGK